MNYICNYKIRTTLLFSHTKIHYLCPMNPTSNKYYGRWLLWLIITSTFVRIIWATTTELGNDEVYYRIFGLFPSLSYFDHPPLVGWLVWLTTGGNPLAGELWVRLGPILIGAANTYLIYRLANRIGDHNPRSGWIAALLYTGSIYCSLIVGTFIMPDTPLSLFWLLSLTLFAELLVDKQPITRKQHLQMLLAGAAVGLAMLSKYTGAYLWAAAAAYILLYNRNWLKSWSLYIALLVTLLCFSPVLIWNAGHDWISFTFHSGRVTAGNSIEWLYFGRELLGGVLYNNPINFVVILCAITAYLRGNRYVERATFRWAMLFSVPMIALFLGISFTRETLPHWAAPGYFALIVLAAQWLITKRRGVRVALISALLTVVVGCFGVVAIRTGIIQTAPKDQPSQILGSGDITLDMYGWQQLGEQFAKTIEADRAAGLVGERPYLVSDRWDEAAHLDTYVALPLGLPLITEGEKVDTHFYDELTVRRQADPAQGGYLVLSSRYWSEDREVFSRLGIDPNKPDQTLTILRGGRPVVNFLIYRINPAHQKGAVLP